MEKKNFFYKDDGTELGEYLLHSYHSYQRRRGGLGGVLALNSPFFFFSYFTVIFACVCVIIKSFFILFTLCGSLLLGSRL